MLTKHKNDYANQTVSYAKYDFDTVCAGVLFLAQNPEHLERLHPFIDPAAFFQSDNSVRVKALRIIVSVMLDIKKKHGAESLDVQYLRSKINSLLDSDDSTSAQMLFNTMVSDRNIIEKSKSASCQRMFTDFLKATTIMNWSTKFADSWKGGEMNNIVCHIKELTTNLDKIKLTTVEELINLSEIDFDKLIDYVGFSNEGAGDLFYMGHKGIDDSVGGFERRALHVFLGATNSGKSMLSHHLIAQSIKQDLSVHIAVVEDRPKSFIRRLLANLTGIEIKRIKFAGSMGNAPFSELEIAKLKDAQKKIQKYVQVDFIYGESVTYIHQRKIEYDIERESKGLKPYDVDIIDYSGHVASKSIGEKTYEKYRNAFAERKDFCLGRNKIGFDFAQLNREGFKKKEADVRSNHGDLAGSYDLSQVCDNILVIHRPPEQIDNHEITFLITKVKDGVMSTNGYTVGENFKCAQINMDYKNEKDRTVDATQTINLNNENKDDKKDATL